MRWSLPVLCAAVVACSDILDSPEEPTVTIEFGGSAATSALQLEVDVGGRPFTLRPGETRRSEAPKAGERPVDVVLRSGSDTLVVDSFAQAFTYSHDRWVHGVVGGPRPIYNCLADVEVRAHPLGGCPADTFFVEHGSLIRGGLVC